MKRVKKYTYNIHQVTIYGNFGYTQSYKKSSKRTSACLLFLAG